MALVFRPSLFRPIISNVSVSQTIIYGLAPREPVTASLRFGEIPRDIISSVCPFASLDNPAPKNFWDKLLVFITIPSAAAQKTI